MADTISLHCRIAALETELRLVKEQLLQYQNSTISLAGLLVRDNQQQPLSYQPHQQASNQQLQEGTESTRQQLDYALQCNANLERQLEASRWIKSVSEAKDKSSEDLLGGSVWGKSPQILESEVGVEEHFGNGEVQSTSWRGVQDSWGNLGDHVQVKDRSMADPFQSTDEKGLADGMQGWKAVVADYERRTRSAVAGNRRFMAHEHNRLAGVSCWVDALSNSGYDRYWEDYADLHQNHTAGEWKQYYEAEIRPRAPASTPLVVVTPPIVTPRVILPEAVALEEFEAATARQVHIRSYSMEDVTKYEVQPAAVPLTSSRHAPALPIAPWPKPEARPFVRQPHEVTHLLDSTDPSLRRTVLISNVPISMTLAGLLQGFLKSDRIVDAKFAGTAGMKTVPPIESNMALVEFLDHEDAQVYVDTYSEQQGFVVRLVPSATRLLRRARVDSRYD